MTQQQQPTVPETPPASQANVAPAKIVVSPQIVGGVCLAISFVAGILFSRNLISKETLAYLGTAEFQAVVASVLLAGAGIWQAIKNRPHGLIQSTAALDQVDAVIAKPKTASEIPVSNVVGSVEEAGRLPGIRRVKTHMTGPTVNPSVGN